MHFNHKRLMLLRMRRIEAEEVSLDDAELVIKSTRQEIDEQWVLYDGFDVRLEKLLRARGRRGVNCHGSFMPRMAVIPPGMDFSNVIDQEDNTKIVKSQFILISNGLLVLSKSRVWNLSSVPLSCLCSSRALKRSGPM